MGGASRDSTGLGALEEGLISSRIETNELACQATKPSATAAAPVVRPEGSKDGKEKYSGPR